VYVLCRPNGKLRSSSYRAKCSTTFTSICDDADCKLFTESHLANNLMPFLLQKKNEVQHSCPEMSDLVFLAFLTVNFRVTFTINLRPLPVSTDVGSAALSTSVQNVTTTCSRVTTFWTEADSAMTRARAVVFLWNLQTNSPFITPEKWGQTFLSRHVWPRFSSY